MDRRDGDQHLDDSIHAISMHHGGRRGGVAEYILQTQECQAYDSMGATAAVPGWQPFRCRAVLPREPAIGTRKVSLATIGSR